MVHDIVISAMQVTRWAQIALVVLGSIALATLVRVLFGCRSSSRVSTQCDRLAWLPRCLIAFLGIVALLAVAKLVVRLPIAINTWQESPSAVSIEMRTDHPKTLAAQSSRQGAKTAIVLEMSDAKVETESDSDPAHSADKFAPTKAEKSSAGDEQHKSPVEVAQSLPSKETAKSEPGTIAARAIPPSWISDPPGRLGDTYRIVVRSGTYADSMVRDEMLDQKMVEASKNYIDDVYYRQSDIPDSIKFDANYLHENCVDKQFPSPANILSADEVFVELKFDKHFRDEIDRRYHHFLSMQSTQTVGGIAAGGLVVLGALYIYLRATARKSDKAVA